MRRRNSRTLAARLVLAIALLGCACLIVSCGNDQGANSPPDTSLVGAPEQGSQHSYKVIMSWEGSDPDGRVVAYETAWHDGIAYTGMFDDLDWEETTATIDTFQVAADSCPAVGPECHHSHAFFVRAIDNDGARDETPAYVGFEATTLTPRSSIVYPPRAAGQFEVTLPTCVKVGWQGSDPDGHVVMFRYALKKRFDPPAEKPPPSSDSRWSPWTPAGQAVITNLTPTTDPEDTWDFFTQAMDNAGAVESVFEAARNNIRIYVDESLDSNPYVSICCTEGACTDVGKPTIACRSTNDPSAMDEPVSIAAGTEVCFRASALPGAYASSMVQIAFLVNDPEEPGAWSTYNESHLCYPGGDQGYIVPPNLNAFYVWVRDDFCEFGSTAVAHIVINGTAP
jgi:hypothetical protein